MYTIDLDNRFYRVFSSTMDKLGIDPMLDRVVPHLRNIEVYTNHSVTQDERGSPDLISFRQYGTEDFWWHILAFNGICSYRDIVEGLTLKIPDIGAIVSITNDNTTDIVENSDHIISL